MPEGVIATVDGGFATLDFVDTSLRGPALDKLLDIGGPGTIETLTRVKGSPRRQYRVPEGNAREAGLLDGGEGSGYVSRPDTGAAAALAAAGGNVNPGEYGEDWHTPVGEHSSANAYVGQTANEDVLQASRGAVSPVTANQNAEVGEGFGGSASPTPHRELIGHVLDNSDQRAVGGVQPVRTPDPERDHVNPGAAANLGLADQFGAHRNDPGAVATEGGESRAEDVPSARTSQFPGDVANPFAKSTPTPETSPGTTGVETGAPTEGDRPQGLPEGEPDEDWKRAELDTYAAWKGVSDASNLPNKAAVLAVIAEQGKK